MILGFSLRICADGLHMYSLLPLLFLSNSSLQILVQPIWKHFVFLTQEPAGFVYVVPFYQPAPFAKGGSVVPHFILFLG